MKRTELAKRIDHTLLGPTATKDAVKQLCEEAIRYSVASACVNPCHVKLVRDCLKDSDVKTCAVIGFPHGMNTSETKAFEAQKAIAAGADELDMVINVAALKEGDYSAVTEDIRAVCVVAEKAPRPVSVKVILEMALLTEEVASFSFASKSRRRLSFQSARPSSRLSCVSDCRTSSSVLPTARRIRRRSSMFAIALLTRTPFNGRARSTPSRDESRASAARRAAGPSPDRAAPAHG